MEKKTKVSYHVFGSASNLGQSDTADNKTFRYTQPDSFNVLPELNFL